MGQVEMNLWTKDLNSTLDNSANSTYYGEKERDTGFWTENTKCTPGKRPDPGSCTRYFLCVEVPPHVFIVYYSYCPLNLFYNSHTSECVSPYFYQRAVRILPRPHHKPPSPLTFYAPPFYTPLFYPPIWPPFILPAPRRPPTTTTPPPPLPLPPPPPTPPTTTLWTPTITTPNPQVPSPCKFPLCNRKIFHFVGELFQEFITANEGVIIPLWSMYHFINENC